MYSKIKVLLLFLISMSALAKLNIVTSTPDIAWLAGQIGGDKVTVKSLLTGEENPHFVEALPSFIHKVASADLFCVVGLELEAAWADKVQKRSGNQKIQMASSGYCDASKNVETLDKMKVALDRSHGDVHSAGNPHYHLGPTYLIMAGESILEKLIEADSENKSIYEMHFKKLKESLHSIKELEMKKLKPFKSTSFMEYHKEFTYFFKDYNLKNIGSVESIAGVPPSASRVVQVIKKIKENNVKIILATDSAPKNILHKLVEVTGVKIIESPLSLTEYLNKNAYKNFQNNLVDKITLELK